MIIRTAAALFALVFAAGVHSQTLTIAGGQTIRASSTEHDAYRMEVNFGWKPEFWGRGAWALSLNHALSVMTFRDRNTVNAVSWAPNIVFAPRNRAGFYPYMQLGLGVAYLSEDEFHSDPKPHPCDCREGITNMGSRGQFESSFAIGLKREQFSIRAKFYHYSNANIADDNEGMDVAEFGISYSF